MPAISNLAAAIHRSRGASAPSDAPQPAMRKLGRHRLSGIEVFGQSFSTIAPASCMVLMATRFTQSSDPPATALGLLAGIAAVSCVVICLRAFTSRIVGSGSLYSYARAGIGPRAALTVGVALLLGYLAVAATTLYRSGRSVVTALSGMGIGGLGRASGLLFSLAMGTGIVWCLARGVRFVLRALLVAEGISLTVVVALLVLSLLSDRPLDAEPLQPGATSALVGAGVGAFLATINSFAGFESAAFLGAEAKRPQVAITSAMTASAALFAALLLASAGFALTGNADLLVAVYLGQAPSWLHPVWAAALAAGMAITWAASALGAMNAASRLLFTAGVDGLLPNSFREVQLGRRIPVAAVAAIAAAVAGGLALDALAPAREGLFPEERLASQFAFVLVYGLSACAAVCFLRHIDEPQRLVSAAGAAAAGVSAAVLAAALWAGFRESPVLGAALIAVAASGSALLLAIRAWLPGAEWRIGTLDGPSQGDFLPGFYR